MLTQGDYWEQGVKSPLLHLWSIGIEWQFYLVWLVIFVATVKIAFGLNQSFKKWLLSATIVLWFILTVCAVLISKSHSFDFLYYHPIVRWTSFLFGIVAAAVQEDLTKKSVKFLSFKLVSLVIILTSVSINFFH